MSHENVRHGAAFEPPLHFGLHDLFQTFDELGRASARGRPARFESAAPETRGRGREKGGALRNVNGDCRALRFGSLRAREQSADAVDGGTEPCAVGHVENRDGTVPRLGHTSLQEAHRADGLGCLSSPDRARKGEKSRERKLFLHHPLPFFSVKTTGMRMRTVRPGLPQREAARATAAQASRSSMSWPLPS